MYEKQSKNFKEGIIWWDTELDKNSDVDVFFFIHDYKGRPEYKYGFKTIVFDLENIKKEEIFMGYQSRLRTNIRKAEKIDFKIEHKLMEESDVEEYVKNFNNFANFKNIATTTPEFMRQMIADKKIYISRIWYNDELLATHSHYVADGIARLFHSASHYNEVDRSINSLSNKFLTHKDIMWFHDKGFKTYDMGGIGNVEGDNSRFEGIIKMKKCFGGQEQILWKGVTANGEKGKTIIEKYFKLK